MITSIKIRNFKSFKKQTFNLSNAVLMAGVNNSGKSSVIQALRMFLRWADIGDPSLLGHGSLNEMKNIASPIKESISISCFFDRGFESKMLINFDDLAKIKIEGSKKDDFYMPSISYISADRWGPRVYLPMNTSFRDLVNVGEYGEYTLDFLNRYEDDIIPDSLIHKKAEGLTLQFNVRAWLEEIAPNVKFEYVLEKRRDTAYSTINGFRPPNAGFGLSYTLPIIVALLGMAAKSQQGDSLLLLENPEAHLHPKGQTAIGKLICLAASAGVQVIVETHSDHLMDGIRIAVKQGDISKDMVCFHYFSLDKDGLTKVESPKISSNGKLDFWPQGFFDQTMKNRAILARR